MGTLNTLAGTSIYLDANVIIYAAEGSTRSFSEPLSLILARVDAGELWAVTSELTLAEVLVKPIRDGNATLVEAYSRRLSNGPTLTVHPVSRQVLLKSAQLRAAHAALRLPDAIHAATAILNGCTTFLTNDSRFTGLPELPVLLVSQLR